MVTCSNDTLVNVFDIEKGQLCRSFAGGHTGYVAKCMFNPQENMVLSTGADNFLFLWDLRQNKVIVKICAHPEPITCLDISHDSTMIVTAAYDGYVRLWDSSKATCMKTLVADSGSTSAVSASKLTPNSKYLYIGTMNN